jgi:hypothetical protein
MTNSITIGSNALAIKEYEGKRVVTFSDIDKVHERASGTAGRNFRANKMRFIKGEDFYEIPKNELPTNFVANSEKRGNPNVMVILITESGYLMLVKSFTDDLAWKVQRELVNTYFRVKQQVQETPANALRLIADQLEEHGYEIVLLKEFQAQTEERLDCYSQDLDKIWKFAEDVISKSDEVDGKLERHEVAMKRAHEFNVKAFTLADQNTEYIVNAINKELGEIDNNFKDVAEYFVDMETKYEGVTAIHIKPVSYKKHNTLDKLQATALHPNFCQYDIYTDNEEENNRAKKLVEDTVKIMRGMRLKEIYDEAEKYNQQWRDYTKKVLAVNAETMLGRLCHGFEMMYRRGLELAVRQVA